MDALLIVRQLKQAGFVLLTGKFRNASFVETEMSMTICLPPEKSVMMATLPMAMAATQLVSWRVTTIVISFPVSAIDVEMDIPIPGRPVMMGTIVTAMAAAVPATLRQDGRALAILLSVVSVETE